MIEASVIFDKSIIHCGKYAIVKDLELWFIYDGYVKVDDWESGTLEQAIEYCMEN